MKKKFNILIVDDQNIFLDGLESRVKKTRKANKIFRANNGYEALDIIKNNNIDILISDIQMPKMDGIKLIMKLRENEIPLKIIVLTGFHRVQDIKPIFRLDVKIILDKEIAGSEINKAINALLKDEKYYSSFIEQTIDLILKGKRKSENKNKAIPILSRREKELFCYFLEGLSIKEIAEKNNKSSTTVEGHRVRIYEKFEVNSRSKLIIKALKYGFID